MGIVACQAICHSDREAAACFDRTPACHDPGKRDTLNLCWANAGPASATLGQH